MSVVRLAEIEILQGPDLNARNRNCILQNPELSVSVRARVRVSAIFSVSVITVMWLCRIVRKEDDGTMWLGQYGYDHGTTITLDMITMDIITLDIITLDMITV